jgi:hypothetical protein
LAEGGRYESAGMNAPEGPSITPPPVLPGINPGAPLAGSDDKLSRAGAGPEKTGPMGAGGWCVEPSVLDAPPTWEVRVNCAADAACATACAASPVAEGSNVCAGCPEDPAAPGAGGADAACDSWCARVAGAGAERSPMTLMGRMSKSCWSLLRWSEYRPILHSSCARQAHQLMTIAGTGSPGAVHHHSSLLHLVQTWMVNNKSCHSPGMK